MAKSNLKEDDNLPATIDEVSALAEQDAGRGASQSSDDKFFPLISIIQKLSPQADRSASEHIDGAEPGDIYLRNFTPPIIPGDEGIVVQPCKMYVEYVEWVPRERGGGMAGRHLKRPKEAKVSPDGFKMTMPSGNDLKETRVWVVNLVTPDGATPFLIPCASTLNTFARAWNTAITQKKEPNGTDSPAWRYLWRLTTKQRKNAKGAWSVFSFAEERKVTTTQEYLLGRALCSSVEEAIEKGQQLAEAVEFENVSKDEDPPF